MYCQQVKRGWTLLLVFALLVSMSGLTFAAKPTDEANLTISNEDFAMTLSEGESYTFEVTARYKGSGSLSWDRSDHLTMVGDSVTKGVNVSATFSFVSSSSGIYKEQVTATDGTVSDSLNATFTVKESGPVNEPPVVEDLTLTTDEDTLVTGTLNATDPEGDALSAEITGSPANGFASVNGLEVTYTPDLNFNGQDAFEVTVSDSSGATDVGTVSITISPVNDPPTAENLALTTSENTPVTGTLVATDPEGDQLNAQISVTPVNGDATANGFEVTYTPDADFIGQDVFEVTVTDSSGATDVGTVSITVEESTPVNEPPVAVDDQATTNEMTPITIDVLANDTDVDGGDLWIEAVTNVTGGSAVNNGSDITFTPGSAGTGGFDYQLNGGSTAHVTVTIEPVTTAPPKYLALGDSIPYGEYYTNVWNYLFDGTDADSYVEQLSRHLSIASGDFIDASAIGHNTVDVLYQIDSLSGVIAEADLITLCVGANDIMDAAERTFYGLDKYNINWSEADAGRDNFELYWPQVIDKIEELNPDATLVVMTVYNPYRESDAYYNLVDPYFSQSTGGDLGLNHLIAETMALDNTRWGDRIADSFDYRVVDVYTTFNSYGDQKDYLTGFYNRFCDPHPNQAGQDVIFEAHRPVVGSIQ